MRTLFAFLIAACAFVGGVHAETLGVERTGPAELQVPAEHYVGFTGHADDGTAVRLSPAASGLSVHLGTSVGTLAVGALAFALIAHGDTEAGVALATTAAVPEEAVKALKSAVDESNKLVREMLDPETGLEARIKSLEAKGEGAADLKEQVQKMATDNAAAIDKINEQTKSVAARADELEVQMQKGLKPGGDAGDLYADVVKALQDDELASAVKAQGGQLKTRLGQGVELGGFDVRAVFKAVTALAASGGDTQVPAYEPMIIAPGQQQVTLLDVLPNTRTESSLIYWVKEVLGSRTNGVAIQSLDFTGTDQGTALGTSDFVFDRQSAETRTFGHVAKIAVQLLEDVDQLRGYLDTQMRYMVRFDLEDQVLNGDGTGKSFSGLKDQATAYDVTQDASTANLTKMDVLQWAITQCALTFFPATAGILHPVDVTSIKLQKDANNNYQFVNAMGNEGIRPWGVPIVGTTQQTADEFTVGAMNTVEVVTRKDVEVTVSTENSDDFEKLLATMRAYGRFGLKVYQPGSIIDGDFSLALTGA